jgi:hypothetical protein
MANDKAKVIDLLRQAQAEGAEVKTESKSGSALTKDALAAESAKPNDWTAWITWTKSI